MKSKYQLYKSTNIPWLPSIPASWYLVKAKFLFNERVQKGYADEPLLAATQTHGVIPKSMYENTTVTAQKDFHLLKLVETGDFVISLRSFQGGIEYAYYRGIISPAYTIFFPKDDEQINNKFFKYFFKSEPFINSLTLFVTGIREGQNIDYNEFKNSLLPLPSYEEQTTIANYLDTQTEKIDLFIFKKQKLIELLKEQKQVVISDAVKNDNAKWKNIKLKFIARVKTGRTPSIEKSSVDFFENGTINWFTPGDFGNNLYLEKSERKIIQEAIDLNEVEIYKPNSLFLIGIGGTLGKIALAKDKASANQQINVITFNSSIFPDFALLYFITIKEMLLKTSEYTTLPILNQTKTKNIFIPLPQLDEQKQIVNYIKCETKRIEEIISRIENEIEIIKVYKQSLIAEVVMGKIKINPK